MPDIVHAVQVTFLSQLCIPMARRLRVGVELSKAQSNFKSVEKHGNNILILNETEYYFCLMSLLQFEIS